MDKFETKLLFLEVGALRTLQVAVLRPAEQQRQSTQSHRAAERLDQSRPLHGEFSSWQAAADEVVLGMFVNKRVNITVEMPQLIVEFSQRARHSIQSWPPIQQAPACCGERMRTAVPQQAYQEGVHNLTIREVRGDQQVLIYRRHTRLTSASSNHSRT